MGTLSFRLMLIVVGTAAYLGLAVLGWGGPAAFFAHPARIALAVTVCILAGASLLARMRAEETLLRTQFGGEYDAYRSRTARLIPGIY